MLWCHCRHRHCHTLYCFFFIICECDSKWFFLFSFDWHIRVNNHQVLITEKSTCFMPNKFFFLLVSFIKHSCVVSLTDVSSFFLSFMCPIATQTEQIRRANRLFAQDSLFLRQYLMIPVDRDTSAQYNQIQQYNQNTLSLSVTENDSTLNRQSTHSPTSTSTMTTTTTHTSSGTTTNDMDAVLSPEEENRKSIEEFLGKIDSTLAKTKKYVATSHARNR